MMFLGHGDAEPVQTIAMALGAGVLAGVLHTFLGADHLAALLPLSVNRKLKAAWQGVRWGAGHSLGVVIVAIILLAGRETLDLTPVEEWGERIVGLMLVALGIWGIRSAFKQNLHVHAHAHDGTEHSHLHVHTKDAHDPKDESFWKRHAHSHAAVGAGTLHGVAGMAHLLGVFPALAAPTLLISMTYLAAFAAGSIFSMAVFAGLFGAITAALGQKSAVLLKGSLYAAAIACMAIGIIWFALTFMPDHDHEQAAQGLEREKEREA